MPSDETERGDWGGLSYLSCSIPCCFQYRDAEHPEDVSESPGLPVRQAAPFLCYLNQAKMTYQQLAEFVDRGMRMSHIYQPVMLIELLKHGGRLRGEGIAKALLNRC